MFESYLKSIPEDHAKSLRDHVITVVHEIAPDASEGTSYGLPAFKHNDRPLIGFSSNKHGLNVYPFDPKLISEVIDSFPDLEYSKGVIRFSVSSPVPKEAVELMTQLRLAYLDKDATS